MKYRLKKGQPRFVISYLYKPYVFDEIYFREYPEELVKQYKNKLEPEKPEKVIEPETLENPEPEKPKTTTTKKKSEVKK